MHDEAGRPINTIGMVEDITERKRAEQRLQESERLLRTLIDASPESILLLDTDETILLANETSAHRLGRPLDKIIGNRPRDLLSLKPDSERVGHFEEVVRTGKAIRFEDERSGRYFENAMHPILDEQGRVAAVAVLAIDRTERKQAEKALREREAKLLEAQEVANLGFYVVELATGRCTCSSVLARLLTFPLTIQELLTHGQIEFTPMIAKQCWTASRRPLTKKSLLILNTESFATGTIRYGGFTGLADCSSMKRDNPCPC